ncbi:MAG TPA: hypothetical protein VEH27_01680, partial [Methylomirabilota bacterium]|nr:hypothetical protein [Methylomirabilota bacterium]
MPNHNLAHPDQWVISHTNQIGKVTRFGYDERGLKVAETNANSEVVLFKYDSGGNLTNLMDGKLHNTYWKYDQEGRVTNKLDHALAESFRYTYDPEDRLLTRWTPEKGTTAYAYDAVGNLTNVNYSASTDLNFRYDASNRLTNMVDASGTSAFTYTGYGALASEDGPWTSDTVTFAYNSGRVRSSAVLQQVSGVAWTNSYVYDPAMRLTNITSPAGVFAHEYDSTA